jgi:hypothetical protein
MGREPPYQRGRESHAAKSGSVIEEQREGRAVGQGGEIAEKDFVGHLLAKVAGRENQAEIGAKSGGIAQKPLGIPLGVIGGARHDDLVRALAPDDAPKRVAPLLFGQAAILAVRPQRQIAQQARGGIAFHVEREGVEIDFFVIREGRRNRRKNAGHAGHASTSSRSSTVKHAPGRADDRLANTSQDSAPGSPRQVRTIDALEKSSSRV